MMFSIMSKAQNIQVLDYNQKTAVAYAVVSATDKSIRLITDENGYADVSNTNLTTSFVVSAMGYQTIEITLDQIKNSGNKVYLLPDNFVLGEVVVSATKFRKNSLDLASRIHLMDQNRVNLLNPQTAADLLGSSGEVFIQKSQAGGGSPMIRGFATNRLLYAVDGVRMNTAIFRAGNLQNVISLDPFAIERTEVLFGPGSVIYGSDAIGGVMSFSTISPRFAPNQKLLVTGNATARYSSANQEKTWHADITIAKRRFSSVTSFTKSDYGDLKMGANGSHDYRKNFLVINENNKDISIPNPDPLIQSPSGYQQSNFMQKLKYRLSQNWDIQYDLHISDISSYARYDRLIETNASGVPSSAVWNYGPQIWRMHQVSITNSSKTKWYDHMVLRGAYQFFEESRIDRRFNNARLRTQKEQVDAYSINLDFEKKSGKHHFNYGMEWVQNDVTSAGSAIDYIKQTPIAVADRYPLSTWFSTAGYINYQHFLGSKSIVEIGARYSHFGLNADFTRLLPFFPFDFTEVKLNNGSFSGNIGFVHRFSDKIKLSAQLGSGFRAPNVDDIGKIFDFTAGNVNVPNPNLKNEQAYNAEININGLISNVVKWDLSGYYTYLDDAMVRRPYVVNGKDSILYNGKLSKSFAIQNAAFARILGTHIGVEVDLGKGFYTGAKYNYQYGTEEMDNGEEARSRHAAPAFGEYRIGYQNKKLLVEFYSLFSAEVSFENLNPEERTKPFIYAKDEQGDPFSPSWYTLNLKARYQIFKYLTINAGVENIADQMYRPYSSGIAAPGRNIVISLSSRF